MHACLKQFCRGSGNSAFAAEFGPSPKSVAPFADDVPKLFLNLIYALFFGVRGLKVKEDRWGLTDANAKQEKQSFFPSTK